MSGIGSKDIVYVMHHGRSYYVWTGPVKTYRKPPRNAAKFTDHNDALMEAVEVGVESSTWEIIETASEKSISCSPPSHNLREDYIKAWKMLSRMGIPCRNGRKHLSLTKRVKLLYSKLSPPRSISSEQPSTEVLSQEIAQTS